MVIAGFWFVYRLTKDTLTIAPFPSSGKPTSALFTPEKSRWLYIYKRIPKKKSQIKKVKPDRKPQPKKD